MNHFLSTIGKFFRGPDRESISAAPTAISGADPGGNSSPPFLRQLQGAAVDIRDILFPPLVLEGDMPVRMRAPLCEQCGDFISTRIPATDPARDADRAGSELLEDLSPADAGEHEENGRVVEAPALSSLSTPSGDSVDPVPAVSAELRPVPLCNACREHIRHLGPYSYQWARSAYRAQGQVRSAVHGFKYRGEWSLHARLTTWLEEAYEFHALSRRPVWDGLVPVPLHPIRRYWRRFNQAEELANELARRRGVPYLPCLRRIRFTPTQTNLDRPDRWRNMHDAFGLRRNYNVRGLHLLIVDDVFTTGATCDACARILRDNGAAEVGIITVARG